MTHVATKPELKEAPKEAHANGRGMVALAERVERHHVQPLPDAHEAVPNPFPPLLWRGLGWGALIGLLLGLLFAWLLLSSTLVIPNEKGFSPWFRSPSTPCGRWWGRRWVFYGWGRHYLGRQTSAQSTGATAALDKVSKKGER